MFNKKELASILVVILILTFTISILKDFKTMPFIFLSLAIVFLSNSIAKKIAAAYFESDIEIRLWTIKRYGVKPQHQFKNNLQAGLTFPIVATVLTFGYFQWLACLVYDVEGKVQRAAKRHGLYRFSEMTEDHIGFIAAIGVLTNLILAIIGYFLNLPIEMNFVALNIYLAAYNLIPASDLDGNKIFFANIALWTFLATVTLISLLAVFTIA